MDAVSQYSICSRTECDNHVGDRVSQSCRWCGFFYCLDHVSVLDGLCGDCVEFSDYADGWIKWVSERIDDETIDSREQIHQSWHRMLLSIQYNGPRLNDMPYLSKVELSFGAIARKALKVLKNKVESDKKKRTEQKKRDDEIARRLLDF